MNKLNLHEMALIGATITFGALGAGGLALKGKLEHDNLIRNTPMCNEYNDYLAGISSEKTAHEFAGSDLCHDGDQISQTPPVIG